MRGHRYGKICNIYITFHIPSDNDLPAGYSLFSIVRPAGLYNVKPPYIRVLDREEVKSCSYVNEPYGLIINDTPLSNQHTYIFEWMYFVE